MRSAARLLGVERAGYRGADRRGILAQLAEPVAPRVAAGAPAGVIGLPLAAAAAMRLLAEPSPAAASVGAADAALVCFVAAGVVLLLRWRLVGEAAAALQGIALALAGLLLVPAIPKDGPLPLYVATLQVTAVTAVLVLCVASLGMAPVRAGLRPGAVAAWAFGLALALAAPLMLLIAEAYPEAGAMAGIRAAEAMACLPVAVLLLARGRRGRHLLFVGTGAALVAIGAACATLAAAWLLPGGVPAELPSFFLVVGAAQLVLLAAADLRSALGDVVLRDVRGRRRWTAAETEVDRLRRVARGRRHDLASMLSAVDGSLMALAQQRDRLSPQTSRGLIGAVRAQVQQLMAMLAPDADGPRWYDLSELLEEVAMVHAAPGHRVRAGVEPGLQVHGHPDRVARMVGNLLDNAATHAPGASVALTGRRIPGPEGDVIEIRVADDGPGLAGAEMESAFEPGWRGMAAGGVPGSGLGLAQCRELADAEGGEIVLDPTHPAGRPGLRGLTARIRIPADGVPDATEESSILRMRPGANGAISDPAVPDRGVGHRDPRVEACLPVRQRNGTLTRERSPDR